LKQVTYVGLDVHQNSITAVWGRRQEKMRWTRVINNDEGLEQLLKEVGAGEAWGVYEASGCGFGLHDWLTQRGWKVSVVAPTHVAKSLREKKTKTDLRDATQMQGC